MSRNARFFEKIRYPVYIKALKRIQRKLGFLETKDKLFGFKLRLDLNQAGISNVVSKQVGK